MRFIDIVGRLRPDGTWEVAPTTTDAKDIQNVLQYGPRITLRLREDVLSVDKYTLTAVYGDSFRDAYAEAKKAGPKGAVKLAFGSHMVKARHGMATVVDTITVSFEGKEFSRADAFALMNMYAEALEPIEPDEPELDKDFSLRSGKK